MASISCRAEFHVSGACRKKAFWSEYFGSFLLPASRSLKRPSIHAITRPADTGSMLNGPRRGHSMGPGGGRWARARLLIGRFSIMFDGRMSAVRSKRTSGKAPTSAKCQKATSPNRPLTAQSRLFGSMTRSAKVQSRTSAGGGLPLFWLRCLLETGHFANARFQPLPRAPVAAGLLIPHLA